MKITAVRGHPRQRPARGAAAPRQRLPLGPLRAHHRGGRDRRRAHGPRRDGRRRRERRRRRSRAWSATSLGHDPARLEEMRFRIANPTASLYNNRTQLLAALEFACLDLLGQKWGVPVSEILGGRLRDRVPFASYLLLPLPEPEGRPGRGPQRRPARGRGPRAQAVPRLHEPQAEGRRLPARVRARVLPRARRRAAGRPLPLRPERRVVHRAGDLVRPGDRGPEATTTSRTPSTA